jgi:hypothetical protein
MKVWVTKYALTEGIQEMEAKDLDPGYPNMISVSPRDKSGDWIGSPQYFHKPNWHTESTEAYARAEKMRIAKIASLRKQITKLEKMKF